MAEVVPIECLVIGAGISGIAVGRWLKVWQIVALLESFDRIAQQVESLA